MESRRLCRKVKEGASNLVIINGRRKKEKEMRLGVFRWMGGGSNGQERVCKAIFSQLMDEVAVC